MAKYKDVKSLGNSKISPFMKNEGYRDRHARRKKVNLSQSKKLKQWCKENNWKFEIKNKGHHWIFKQGRTLLEWWPSSAKLVKNKQWHKGLHCHDYLKVIHQLRRANNK